MMKQTEKDKQATKELQRLGYAWGFKLKVVNGKYDLYEDDEIVEEQFDTVEAASRYCNIIHTIDKYRGGDVAMQPERLLSPQFRFKGYTCVKEDADFHAQLRALSEYNVDVGGGTVAISEDREQDVVFLKALDTAAANFIRTHFKEYAPKYIDTSKKLDIADIPQGGNPFKNAHAFRRERADYADSNREWEESLEKSTIFEVLNKIYEEEQQK